MPFITSSGVGRAMKSVEPGKLRIRRLRRLQNSQPVAARPEHVDLFGDPRNLDRGMFSAQEDFNYLADMGVPSDIFETAEVEQGGRQENGENNGFFKPRIINISKSTLVQFPDARPFKMKPRAIRLNMGPCRQIEPERYSQVSSFFNKSPKSKIGHCLHFFSSFISSIFFRSGLVWLNVVGEWFLGGTWWLGGGEGKNPAQLSQIIYKFSPLPNLALYIIYI